ncbi:MAG: hypothetical protein Q4C45_02320 [Oscillospiraceae bacterium]|nr:hypothetical protein [Oscillospiraceae bacterium]
MANRSYGQDRPGRAAPAWQAVPAPLSPAQQETPDEAPVQQPVPGTPTFTEPEVRRWPHPVDGAPPIRQALYGQPTDALLHYIQCSLSYQNQLLADIKALLQQMASDSASDSEEK